MNDTITGVLVLQRDLAEDGVIYHLFFQYTRYDGIIGYSHIPMKPKDSPKPDGYTGPLWDFVRENPVLRCSPSVRILGPTNDSPDHFHNSGLWANDYVEMAQPMLYSGESSEICRKINELPTKEQRDELIFELRRKQVLM